MTRTSLVRLAAGVAAAATAVLLAAPPAAHAARPAEGVVAVERAVAPARTTLTFAVTTCRGCRVRLSQARFDEDGQPRIWRTRARAVRHGQVSFTVATRRTVDLSAAVVAPWADDTGFVSQVAWRYAGERVGTPVDRATARTKSRGAGCWAGTEASAATIALRVRTVRLDRPGRPRAVLAWAAVTQPWNAPLSPATGGVLSEENPQDVLFCLGQAD